MLKGPHGWIDTVIVSPDGKFLLASSHGEVRLWDVNRGETLWTTEVGLGDASGQGADIHFKGSGPPLFSPDGKWLVASPNATLDDNDEQWSVILQSVAERTSMQKVPVLAGASISTMVFSPDSTKLALVVNRARPAVWDLTTRKFMKPLGGGIPQQAVTKLRFSPDGKLLALSAYDTGAIAPPFFGASQLENRSSRCPQKRSTLASPSCRIANCWPWRTRSCRLPCMTQPRANGSAGFRTLIPTCWVLRADGRKLFGCSCHGRIVITTGDVNTHQVKRISCLREYSRCLMPSGRVNHSG